MKKVIVIDAIVGAGKTTLGQTLERHLGIQLYRELNNPDTEELLNKFYADKKRWAFTLQIHFLNQRFAQIKEIHRKNGGLLDRSIFGDRIFAEMLMEDGYMSEEEFHTYTTLLDNMLEHAQNPSLLVFIKCDVDTAIERIKQRNRGLEGKVERKYWERLHEKYEKWCDGYNYSPKIVLDVKNFDSFNKDNVEELLRRIEMKEYD
ncbi:deoxynucleoside kinase [Anaeromicrobium sediminis]|uniref:Deoxyguanosine kinase n=1 Tax=Anaeromicrobium sediminis TaxID=1478221 RepID=A0A267M847_9FIRM|nr:deoxynucleoside kinase [Anaeromicrobium sediminis]PAB55746.1 deoxyguanosine kinase [Anaeromicrobium sediminis]